MSVIQRWVGGIFVAAVLGGCAHVDPSVYANETPKLDLAKFFDGTVIGHGMFQGRDGQVKRRFVVAIRGTWSGDRGTLDETFTWSDGKKEHRVWDLRRTGDDAWTGTAGDVVGEAKGVVRGNTLYWQYQLQVPVDDKVYVVDFDDWIYRIDDKVALNHAVMSKYGVHLGDVFLSFQR